MKRVRVVWGALILVLVMSLTVGASSFQADGSYLLGFGDYNGDKSQSRGFLVNGAIEFVPNLLVDGSFLSLNYTKLKDTELAEGESLNERLITVGGLYRVLSEPDLQVLVGAGLTNYNAEGTTDKFAGKGIYGKVGLEFEVMPKVHLLADLSYAPKFKLEEKDGSVIAARATVSYELIHDISLQGTVKHYKVSATDVSTSSNTLVGGGLVLSF